MVKFPRFSLLFCVLQLILKCSIAKQAIQDATIYEGESRQGASFRYSDNPSWSDLKSMMVKNGLEDIGSVCVTGPWIMYRLPDFDSAGPQDYAVTSGADYCVQPGRIESMQPVGTTESPFSPSITFFTEKNFGSQGFSVTSARGSRFFMNLNGPVKSIVIVGISQWTIFDSAEKSYCLATNFDPREKLPVCLVADLELLPIGKEGDPVYISNMFRGCAKDVKPEQVITIEDCRYFGERRPDPNEPDVYRPRVLSENLKNEDDQRLQIGGDEKNQNEEDLGPYTKTCTGGKPDKEISEFIKLLVIRLNHDFASPLQILWPTNKEDVWKTEIIDMTWDIAMSVIPNQIVPLEYMQIMREFMIYHLSLVWKKTGTKGQTPLPERFLKTVQHDLDLCSRLLEEHEKFLTTRNFMAWMNTGTKSIFEQFNRERKQDIVIDTAYVVANMVLGICHHLFEYRNNFWANYIYTFNTMYLFPLIEDWKTMKIEDGFILGGYDYESQYQRLSLFATVAIEEIPNLQPFDKPQELKPKGS